MITIDEIKKYKEYYTKELYDKTRKEQREDQQYHDDTFDVSEVQSPHKVYRSGFGARMSDAPAEHVITSNPKAYIEQNGGSKEIGTRISKVVNDQWIPLLKWQNPNPPKEFVKNCLLRGESYIKLAHDEQWAKGNKPTIGLPIKFLIPDPMVIYASKHGTDEGIPDNVIVWYQRQALDVIVRYPTMEETLRRKFGDLKNKAVEWWEYWDKDVRYWECDGVAVLKDGIQKNLYGFAPFIRKYSGFGRESQDGELSSLIVGDLRHSRDLIKEECIFRSDIVSSHALFAHKPIIVTTPGVINEDDIKRLDLGAYGGSVINRWPPGSKFEDLNFDLYSPQAYQYLQQIRAELNARCPYLMAGFPVGENARQQIEAQSAAGKRYATIVENTEHAFSIAIKKAFDICKEIPSLRPDILHKEDLDIDFAIKVSLQASDPVEEDRKITLGDRLWNQGNGAIDLETFHTKFLGFTLEESSNIIDKMMADNLMLYDPAIKAVWGTAAAEEMGYGDLLEKAQQMRMGLEEQQKGLRENPPATTTERVKGEVKTPVGRGMMDMALSNRGQRKPPQPYKRGE